MQLMAEAKIADRIRYAQKPKGVLTIHRRQPGTMYLDAQELFSWLAEQFPQLVEHPEFPSETPRHFQGNRPAQSSGGLSTQPCW